MLEIQIYLFQIIHCKFFMDVVEAKKKCYFNYFPRGIPDQWGCFPADRVVTSPCHLTVIEWIIITRPVAAMAAVIFLLGVDDTAHRIISFVSFMPPGFRGFFYMPVIP